MRALRFLQQFIVLVFFVFAAPVLAQSDAAGGFDFAEWEKTATRAEGIVESAQASSPALESLRVTLADYRSRALDLQDDNDQRIATLQSQLAALGAAPEDGASEAGEVALRRETLTHQLAEARAPVLAAQEAYLRADGLISGIDTIIRDRLADQLFLLGASPLNPIHWPGAIAEVNEFFTAVWGDIRDGFSSEAGRVMLWQTAPLWLGLSVLGVLLITSARRGLMLVLGVTHIEGFKGISSSLKIFDLLAGVLLPLLGFYLLGKGLTETGLLGLQGAVIADGLVWIGLAIFGFRWISATLFSPDSEDVNYWLITPDQAVALRRVLNNMGLVLALSFLLQRILALPGYSDEAAAVLMFPVVLLSGLLLARFDRLKAKTNPDG